MANKAQSQIITTVLLILIVLAAVTVIGILINRFLGRLDDKQASCIEIRLEIERALSEEDTITIERQAGGGDSDVTGLEILIDGELAEINAVNGESCSGDECDTGLKRLERKEFKVTADFSGGAKIEVAPRVGENKNLCEISDTASAT